MRELIEKRMISHRTCIESLLNDSESIDLIASIAESLVESLNKGGQIFFCGNGGSAADSQHLATELVSRFYKERKAINAESLSVNTSTLTAIGNDYSFDRVFSRQVEAKGKYGDVLIGISTSGNSANVIKAFEAAKTLGMKCIGMTGEKSCKMDDVCDFVFHVPESDTPRIQEMHILVGHIICEIIEDKFA